MAERTCFNCVYCICDPFQWLRWLDEDESIVPQCANHPQWPGRLHDVPGVPCRRYHPKPPVPQGDNVRMIPLMNGGYAYVDAADYEWLNRWHWRLENGYAARFEKHKVILMHRQILPPPPGQLVDHADGNQVNNCRANLRPANRTQNRGNQRKRYDTASRFKGTFYDPAVSKWYARCTYKRQNHNSGYCETEEEAGRAYDVLAVAWFGEFARLNFPREWTPERRAQVYAENAKQREEADKGKGKSKRAKGKRKNGKSSRERAKTSRAKSTAKGKKGKSKSRQPRRA